MTRIETPPFGVVTAPLRARRLNNLVTSNKDWLSESSYSGSLKRYGNSHLRATKNVARLALASLSGPVHPFEIRLESDSTNRLVTVGIGTVIRNQTVWHPENDIEVTGSDIDYYLDRSVDEDRDIHDLVARELIDRAVELEPNRIGSHDTLNVFATTIPGASHQPIGLARQLGHRIGEPTVLQLPQGNSGPDPYGVLMDGATVQLWASGFPIPSGF